MVAARIEIGRFDEYFEGETPGEIISKLSEIQDLDCLVMMARQSERKKKQFEVDKLEAFLNKYYNNMLTIKDIEDLNIHLSIGNIVCRGVAEGDEQVAALKER